MVARNQCGRESDALLSDTTSGVTPPLLPTLVVAVVLATASFYCPGPAQTPATAAAVRMSTAATSPAPDAAADTGFVPAALAFPRQFPLAVAAHVEAAALQQAALQPPHRPAARIAASRRAPAPKGVQAPADAVLVASAAGPARLDPPAVAETEDGVLPGLALPFAPTIRAVARVGTFVGVQSAAVGAEAAALGDVMADLVGRLR